MLGDILEGLFEGYIRSRGTPSRRWRILARLFFGALGAGLAAVGAIVIAGRADKGTLPFRLSTILMFVAMASFFLFNVMLARKWPWPAILFVLGFVLMFATRIAFGP